MRVSETHEEIQRKFQITSSNNSLVFSWKYPIQWYVISIPHGQYTIEELNEQLNQRIIDISSITSPLKLHGNINTINVEITHPAVVIDIYQSSIRTALGFQQHPDVDSLSFLTYGEYSVDNGNFTN